MKVQNKSNPQPKTQNVHNIGIRGAGDTAQVLIAESLFFLSIYCRALVLSMSLLVGKGNPSGISGTKHNFQNS